MKLEIAVYSTEAALAAQEAGACRIELCSAPAEGGLTPSAGTMRVTRRNLTIPIHVMIRPREGDFCYSDQEFKIMLLDVAAAKIAGMEGIVCGILQKDGTIDEQRMKLIVEAAHPMNVTFHRAFDMSENLEESLEIIIKCGISRVLTSGGKQTAIEGIQMIKQLSELSAGRISIMPGSGINEHNISEIIQIPGIQEVHLSAKKYKQGLMEFRNPEIAMGSNIGVPEYDLLMPDTEAIARINMIIQNK
jgi:copper homeostasis protein